MKTFLNEEKKKFKDLSDAEMLAIIKAKITGECEIEDRFGDWEVAGSEGVEFHRIYRTKPPKQLVIPWAVLKKDIKYVAMEKSGNVYGYRELPRKANNEWLTATFVTLHSVFDFDTNGIDWETSLVTRPECI